MGKLTITPLTELADWIQPDVIAEAILDELEEQGIHPSLENGKTIWRAP